MSTSQTSSPCVQKTDPLKRVNYTFGMVLGVDEFRQEQTYLIDKDHSQYRLAHGYGTVCGLQVQIATSQDLEVQVSTGVAINPQGQEIRVQQVMCARLNDWLTSNQSALQAIFGNPPMGLSLCVVLCFRECPTDVVPVPGEPCRSQQDAMAPSRIADSFQLKLCLDRDQVNTSPPIDPSILSGLCFRPLQYEEDAIREFGRLLRGIQITDIGPSSITVKQLEDMVRQIGTGQLITPPPISSPPLPIYLFVDDVSHFLRAAFRVWVTEVRPSLGKNPPGSGCGCPAEQCVLLAELHFNVGKNWQVSSTVDVDESRRPYLLETRLLQEYLLGGLAGASAGGSSGFGGPGLSGTAVVAAGTFQVPKNAPPAAIGPTFNGLNATAGAQANTFLLNWSGFPAYSNPTSSPPGQRSYVIKGSAIAGPTASSPYVVQLMAFQDDGILISVLGTRGNVATAAAGFSVEISEIT